MATFIPAGRWPNVGLFTAVLPHVFFLVTRSSKALRPHLEEGGYPEWQPAPFSIRRRDATTIERESRPDGVISFDRLSSVFSLHGKTCDIKNPPQNIMCGP